MELEFAGKQRVRPRLFEASIDADSDKNSSKYFLGTDVSYEFKRMRVDALCRVRQRRDAPSPQTDDIRKVDGSTLGADSFLTLG